MIHLWKNTYNESMGDFFARTLKNEQEKDILNMLWHSFRLTYLIQSSFFESIRVGDDKYSLWVHKGKNEVVTVKYVVL